MLSLSSLLTKSKSFSCLFPLWLSSSSAYQLSSLIMFFPSKSHPTRSQSPPDSPSKSPPESPPESGLAVSKEPSTKDNPNHPAMDSVRPLPPSVKSDDFDIDAFMSDDEEDPAKVQKRQMKNIVKLLNNDFLTESQRADLFIKIEVSLNPPVSVAASLPYKNKTSHHRDRDCPLELLVTDRRFIRTSPYWKMESIMDPQTRSRPFPVGKNNCKDLKSIYEYSCGVNTKLASYQSAAVAIGHYIHYSVCLESLQWEHITEMAAPGGLWTHVCNQRALSLFTLALQKNYSGNSQRSYTMSLLHFIRCVYRTNKIDIIEFSGMTPIEVDDIYHRAYGKLLALAGDLKKLVKTQKSLSSALKDRVNNREMLDLEAYEYYLQALENRIHDTYTLVEANLIEQADLQDDDDDVIPTLEPMTDLFQRVCIYLQTSMAVNTEGQRRQLYDHLYVTCLQATIYKTEDDEHPSMIMCSDENVELMEDLLDKVMGDDPPFAVTFRYYNDVVEKRLRHTSQPYFSWNVGGMSGVVLVLYYLIYLRPQFVELFGEKHKGRDKTALFYHTKSGQRLTANNLFATADRGYRLIVGSSSFPDHVKEEWSRVKIGPGVMRRTYATHSYVSWKKKESFLECSSQEEFLDTCAAKMNTSPEELFNTYTATQTPVDMIVCRPTPLMAAAAAPPPPVNDDVRDKYDNNNKYDNNDYDDHDNDEDEDDIDVGGELAGDSDDSSEVRAKPYRRDWANQQGCDDMDLDTESLDEGGDVDRDGSGQKMGKAASYSVGKSRKGKGWNDRGHRAPNTADSGKKHRQRRSGGVQTRKNMVKMASKKTTSVWKKKMSSRKRMTSSGSGDKRKSRI